MGVVAVKLLARGAVPNPNKKQLMAVSVPETALWQIVYNQGGRISDELKGFYTSQSLAERAIATFKQRVKEHFGPHN